MWSKHSHVVLRYVEPVGVVGALPMTVLADAGVVVVLYMAGGATCAWPTVDRRPVRDLPLDERWGGEWDWAERQWQGRGLLIVHREGNGYALWHFLDDDGSFAGWYVNLERPWVRTGRGFDTRDHTLDLWVEPDGEWRWKDEDELESAVAHHWYSPAEADTIRAEGERVLAEWPFPTGWEDWREPDGWEPAKLPPGWDAV
jgi:hypothetical protein